MSAAPELDLAGTDDGIRDDGPVRFTRPGTTPREAARQDRAPEREDEPPADVPRDQHDQPIIVLPDGSGVAAYRRASKYGRLICDDYNIHQWDLRNVVHGMSRAHHLVVRAAAVQSQTDSADIASLQDIASRAKIIAGADSGAMTGTALHKLSERRDAGDDLSFLDPLSTAALDQYDRLMSIVEVLASEMFVVLDGYGTAGTLDRAVRLLVDLTFPDGVTIPAGTILIIDVKTGKITSAPYWGAEFTCQQFVYDAGVPYLPGVTILKDRDKRSTANIERVEGQPGQHGRITWDEAGVPGGPNHRYSLILHVPAYEPHRASWERVDLDTAYADIEAAAAAWERARVPRRERFLRLPDEAFAVSLAGLADRPRAVPDGEVFTYTCAQHGRHPGTLCPGCIAQHRDAAAVSQQDAVMATYADPVAPDSDTAGSTSSESIMNPRLHEILRERIRRADSTEAIDAIYDAWGQGPTWDDVLTEDCQAVYDRLIPPADPAQCERCNADTHACPGCGRGTAHGVPVCSACSLRVALDEAPDRATIALLWDAHGPDGVGLWADEHQAAGVARYQALPAMDGWPDLDAAPEPPDPGYPVQVGGVILHCHECLLPPGHPDADDPIAWCDCAPGETCMDAAVSCRQRAHAPDWIGHARCDVHGEHPMTVDCPECPPAPPPGPFDGTADLADLRDAIDQAPDTAAVDALYDAHGPDGDGLWDDECTARAQAAYDRLSPSTVPS